MKRRLGLLACVLTVLLAGCSGGISGMALPSDGWPAPGTLTMMASQSGPFHAALRDGVACAWLGPKEGRDLWPVGYSVRFHPTELINPQGKVIASEGDTIIFAGGGVRAKPGEPEPGAQCLPKNASRTVRLSVDELEGIPRVVKFR
jgi:hypothetical protein